MPHDPFDLTRRSLLRTTGALAGSSIAGGSLVTNGSQPARAQTQVIDDFDDSDLSEYSFDRGSSGASIVNSPVHGGSNALALSGVDVEMISRPGGSTPDLANYPSAGDTFRYHVYATGGVHYTNYTYGVQDHENRYFIRMAFTDDEFRLYRYENGNATKLVEDDMLTLAEDTWYELEVDWQTDGTHIITLYDDQESQVAQIQESDPTWSSGGIGYDGYMVDGGTLYIDDVEIVDGDNEDSEDPPQSGPVRIEDFETSSLSNYVFERGESGTNIVSSPTKAGNGALELTGTTTEMISTTGLDYYPAMGDTFSIWVYATGGAPKTNFTYGVQDHNNRYFVQLDYEDGQLQNYVYSGGDATTLGKAEGVPYTENEWYRLEIQWGRDGTHTATLYDQTDSQVAQVSGTNWKWLSGGIGFDAYLDAGGTVYYDELTPNTVRCLGGYESGLDGWGCQSHAIDRANRDGLSSAVTRNEHALWVAPSGTTVPIIENQSRLQNADLVTAPHLGGRVIPDVYGSNADVDFTIRYYRSDSSTVHQTSVTIPQKISSCVYWDMSSFPAGALENPERIEVEWCPADQHGNSSFDHTGFTMFGNLRLYASPAIIGAEARADHLRNLKQAHGLRTGRTIQNTTTTTESGTLSFKDGTKVNYTYEKVGTEKFKYTIDGQVYKSGGGW